MNWLVRIRRLLAPHILAALASTPAFAGASDIPVMMHVVFCAPDLLHCRDVDTVQTRFDSMDVCQVDVETLEAALPADGSRVFARCRHRPGADNPAAAPPALP